MFAHYRTMLLLVVTAAGLALASRAVAEPAITALSEQQAPAGWPLTIYGAEFGDVQGDSVVMLADQPLFVVDWADDAITVLLSPAGDAAPLPPENVYLLTVHADGNGSSNEVPFFLAGPPAVPIAPSAD